MTWTPHKTHICYLFNIFVPQQDTYTANLHSNIKNHKSLSTQTNILVGQPDHDGELRVLILDFFQVFIMILPALKKNKKKTSHYVKTVYLP